MAALMRLRPGEAARVTLVHTVQSGKLQSPEPSTITAPAHTRRAALTRPRRADAPKSASESNSMGHGASWHAGGVVGQGDERQIIMISHAEFYDALANPAFVVTVV